MAPPVNPDQPAPKKQEPIVTVFFIVVLAILLYFIGNIVVNKYNAAHESKAAALTVELPPYVAQQEFGPLTPQETQLLTKLGGSKVHGFFHPRHLALVSSESLAGGQLEIVKNGTPPHGGPYLKVTQAAISSAMGDMEAYAAHHSVEHFGIGGNTSGEVSFRVQPASESVRYLVIDSNPESIQEFWPGNTDRSPAYPGVVAAFTSEETARAPSFLDKQVPEGLYRFYQRLCETAVQTSPINDHLQPAPIEEAAIDKGTLTRPLGISVPLSRLPQEAADHLVCESQGAALAFARSGVPYLEYLRKMNASYTQSFEGRLVSVYNQVNRDEYEHYTAV